MSYDDIWKGLLQLYRCVAGVFWHKSISGGIHNCCMLVLQICCEMMAVMDTQQL